MERKPEIQYIGQFYVHGSEAKVLAPKAEPRKAKTTLPAVDPYQIRKVHVDAVAIGALLTAALMLITIVFGALRMQSAWADYELAAQYVTELRQENQNLKDARRADYDLDAVRASAESMGMVPIQEVTLIPVKVTMPLAEPEPTAWDDFLWFMNGLFA